MQPCFPFLKMDVGQACPCIASPTFDHVFVREGVGPAPDEFFAI
jgi:hypothetical protein